MNGEDRKKGGLIIELFKTTRASMKFGQNESPSGIIMVNGGLRFKGVVDPRPMQLNQERRFLCGNSTKSLGHTGEHLLRANSKIHED